MQTSLPGSHQSVQPDEPAIVAVDAPTLIPNATGSRLPDKLSHKYFGKYHAGCYPANQNLPFADRTINFGLELESRGFAHAPTIEPQKLSRYQNLLKQQVEELKKLLQDKGKVE